MKWILTQIWFLYTNTEQYEIKKIYVEVYIPLRNLNAEMCQHAASNTSNLFYNSQRILKKIVYL